MLLEWVNETGDSHHPPFQEKKNFCGIYDAVAVGVIIHRSKNQDVLSNYCRGVKEHMQVPWELHTDAVLCLHPESKNTAMFWCENLRCARLSMSPVFWVSVCWKEQQSKSKLCNVNSESGCFFPSVVTLVCLFIDRVLPAGKFLKENRKCEHCWPQQKNTANGFCFIQFYFSVLDFKSLLSGKESFFSWQTFVAASGSCTSC